MTAAAYLAIGGGGHFTPLSIFTKKHLKMSKVSTFGTF
jgi:hypothetical protein